MMGLRDAGQEQDARGHVAQIVDPEIGDASAETFAALRSLLLEGRRPPVPDAAVRKDITMSGNPEAGAQAQPDSVDARVAEFFARLRAKRDVDRELVSSLEAAWVEGKLRDVKTLQSILCRKAPTVNLGRITLHLR